MSGLYAPTCKFNQKKFLACHRLKIEQKLTNIDVFIDGKKIFLMQQFNMNDNEIEQFMKKMFEKHFRFKKGVKYATCDLSNMKHFF